MEKKERQTLEMKIIVDTKELDEAIEKINSLIELGKEFQKLNLSSTAQEDRERLKDLEIERIASKLTSRLREQINLVSRTPEESQQVEGRRKQCDDGDDQSESTDDTRIPVKVTADLKKVKSAIKCAIRHIRAFDESLTAKAVLKPQGHRSLFKGITEFENTEPKGSLFIYQKRKRGKRTWKKSKSQERIRCMRSRASP